MARFRAAKIKKLHDNPDFLRQSCASEEELFSSEDAAILCVLRNSRCSEVLLKMSQVFCSPYLGESYLDFPVRRDMNDIVNRKLRTNTVTNHFLNVP